MTELEIQSGFASLDPQHTFYRALLALIDDAVTLEQSNVTIPHLADAPRHYNAGRLGHALDMKTLVEDTMKKAQHALARAEDSRPRS